MGIHTLTSVQIHCSCCCSWIDGPETNEWSGGSETNLHLFLRCNRYSCRYALVSESHSTTALYNTNYLTGGASLRVVNSTVTVVGFIGEGGTLTLSGVDGGTAGGTKLLALDYINADFVFSNTDCSNCRNAFISVNGGTAVQVQLPISAQVGVDFLSIYVRLFHGSQNWDTLFSGYLVSLSGFKAGKTNTIQIANPSAFAPDFYRVGVAV